LVDKNFGVGCRLPFVEHEDETAHAICQMGAAGAHASAALLTLVMASGFAWQALATPALTPEQEATARRVEEQLMAPCCFGSTVATHHSPAADAIRDEVRSLVARGRNEQEILNLYLDRYGERILAQPVARGFNLLAYWVPAIGWLCGTAVVVVWLLRRRETVAAQGRFTGRPDDSEEARRQRHQLEEELAAFDE